MTSTMTFPSDVQVYRHESAGLVAVFCGRQPLCYAGSERQALEWTWAQIERRTDLWAEMTKLERAFADLRMSLPCSSGICE